jgi:chromate transporter
MPEAAAAAAPPTAVSLRQAARVWAKIGLLGFGGPAGQIALMHGELVERRRWIDEDRFLHALNYCMLLPGPEAQQLATYIGWLMHRTWGGVVAGVLFVLPGFAAILGLSVLYAQLHALPVVIALFFGLKAAVVAIVAEAVWRLGRRALRTRGLMVLAGLAFVAIFAFGAPFPAVVLGAGACGWLGHWLGRGRAAGATAIGRTAIRAETARSPTTPSPTTPSPMTTPPTTRPPTTGAAAPATAIDALARAGGLAHTVPSLGRALRCLVVWATLWAGPVLLLARGFGARSVYVTEAVFFSKAAAVTFGGAYSVLAYVAQRAVETYGWLRPGEMLDGLGMAETTPGPLILVLQFVGFMGAFRHPGGLAPLGAGLVGALVTCWVTFVPCFLWIFLGAPYVEALRGHRPLGAALSAITAAVVGVILNLSVWFAVHVVFREVRPLELGPLHLRVPVWATFDARATALAGLAAILLLRLAWGVPRTLATCVVLGALLALLR